MRIIEKIYTSFKCKRCYKEIILLTDEIYTTLKQGRYICCSHCGCKSIVKEKVTDDLRECMSHGSWKRASGKMRQVRSK